MAKDLPLSFTLNNGQQVPAIGLGTFQGEKGNGRVKEAVLQALKLGYRHIDTASAYGNEREIGEAIKESGVPRENIFVTSKLPQTSHEPEEVMKSFEETLNKLQLEYVNLYLMHFSYAYEVGDNNETIRHESGNGKPVIDYDLSRRYTETWMAMEKLVDIGKAKSIGLSNFNILKTGRILEVARIRPAVNQVELHPYLPQHELLSFSRSHKICLMAHQPLGGRPVSAVRAHPDMPPPTEDPEIIKVSKAMNISPAQVCLSWALQRETPVIPKSVQHDHMQQNLALKRLPDEHFATVDSLAEKNGASRFLDPEKHVGFDVFDEKEDQPTGNAAPWD